MKRDMTENEFDRDDEYEKDQDELGTDGDYLEEDERQRALLLTAR